MSTVYLPCRILKTIRQFNLSFEWFRACDATMYLQSDAIMYKRPSNELIITDTVTDKKCFCTEHLNTLITITYSVIYYIYPLLLLSMNPFCKIMVSYISYFINFLLSVTVSNLSLISTKATRRSFLSPLVPAYSKTF